jgi:plasmid stabilization system protein ParE
MSAYILSPDALQDLRNIWDCVAFDNGSAADQLEEDLFHAFEKLARRPRMGHIRSDGTERDVRFWPTGSYLIVYREGRSALQVLAILHGARDVPEVIRKRNAPPGQDRANTLPDKPPAKLQPRLTSTSPATNKKNTTEITPFIVKNAAFSLLKSSWRTSRCS